MKDKYLYIHYNLFKDPEKNGQIDISKFWKARWEMRENSFGKAVTIFGCTFNDSFYTLCKHI